MARAHKSCSEEKEALVLLGKAIRAFSDTARPLTKVLRRGTAHKELGVSFGASVWPWTTRVRRLLPFMNGNMPRRLQPNFTLGLMTVSAISWLFHRYAYYEIPKWLPLISY